MKSKIEIYFADKALILLIVFTFFGCGKKEKYSGEFIGCTLYNVTTVYEDCDIPSIIFNLKISNISKSEINDLSTNKNVICAHIHSKADINMILENGDTLYLKTLNQTYKDGAVLIDAFLQDYEIKGSLKQIEVELKKLFDFGYKLCSNQLLNEKDTTIYFQPGKKMQNHYYLNGKQIFYADEAQLNKGNIEAPIFEKREIVSLDSNLINMLSNKL